MFWLPTDRGPPACPSVRPASDLESSKPNKREVSSGTVVDAAPDLMGLMAEEQEGMRGTRRMSCFKFELGIRKLGVTDILEF